jgi:ketosteroid isomerase-like protein
MFTFSRNATVATLLAVTFLLSCFVTIVYAKSRIQFPEPDMMQTDKKTANEIAEFYDEIEDALSKKELDKLMTYYADDYNHNGVDKQHLRNLWANMFTKFDKLYSTHIFSKVEVKDTEAHLKCTGVLMGWPKGGNDYEIVDNWTVSPHYMSKKSGSWKIVGGATRWHEEEKETGEYRLEFHPFF